MKPADRLEALKEAVQALDADVLWQRWLTTRRRFRRYSIRNQILIAVQRPDTKAVAGFHSWRTNFNRQVKKGATALWILAPATIKLEETDPETGENLTRLRFKPVPVFALEDTMQIEGQEVIPIEPPIEQLAGDTMADAFTDMVKAAQLLGVTAVRYESLQAGRHGYYRPGDGSIGLREDDELDQQFKTLVHEVSHHLVRSKLDPEEQPDGYAAEEVLVEATAWCVCDALGLDSVEYSARYLSAWGGDSDAFERITTLVGELATQIEDTFSAVRQGSIPSPRCGSDGGSSSSEPASPLLSP